MGAGRGGEIANNQNGRGCGLGGRSRAHKIWIVNGGTLLASPGAGVIHKRSPRCRVGTVSRSTDALRRLGAAIHDQMPAELRQWLLGYRWCEWQAAGR